MSATQSPLERDIHWLKMPDPSHVMGECRYALIEEHGTMRFAVLRACRSCNAKQWRTESGESTDERLKHKCRSAPQ